MIYTTFDNLLEAFPELLGLRPFYHTSDLNLMRNEASMYEHMRPNLHYFSTIKVSDNLKFWLLTSDGFISCDTDSNMTILNFCNKYSGTHKLIYVVTIEYCPERQDGLVIDEYFDIIVYL